MRKIIFVMIAIVSLGLIGCVSQKKYAEYSKSLFYDEFGKFFITESNSVSFEYKPVGSITAVAESGYSSRKYVIASAQDALRVLYDEAEKNGADGIINLKITYEWFYDKDGKILAAKSVIATGMAIRRSDESRRQSIPEVLY
jgi:uncharacterized protein YbjQ (UPF0145 family)